MTSKTIANRAKTVDVTYTASSPLQVYTYSNFVSSPVSAVTSCSMLESDCSTVKTSNNLFLEDDSGITGAIFKMRLDALYTENVCFSCTDGTTTKKTNSIVASNSCGSSAAKFT